MPASLVSLVLLVEQLGAAQLTTIVAALHGDCKQDPGKMADGYPMSYDISSHLMFYIYHVRSES